MTVYRFSFVRVSMLAAALTAGLFAAAGCAHKPDDMAAADPAALNGSTLVCEHCKAEYKIVATSGGGNAASMYRLEQVGPAGAAGKSYPADPAGTCPACGQKMAAATRLPWVKP